MPSPPRPPGIQSILDDLANGPRFASLDAVNRHLAQRMQEYNAQPQPELGGLSPVEMSQGFTLRRNPDTVRAPDVAYIARVFRADGSVALIDAHSALYGEDVLAGFSCELESVLS